jgi:uncharacterized membrane protein
MSSSRLSAAAVLSAAIGLALAIPPASAPSKAQEMKTPPKVGKTAEQLTLVAAKPHLVRCYGINAAYKNDCAAGAHSCAGQASAPRDPKSFVLLPAGDCAKIEGGTLKAM